MTRQEFIDILDKNDIIYNTDYTGKIYVDNAIVLGRTLAYVTPGTEPRKFSTTADHDHANLVDLKPEDLELMIAHYRKFHPEASGNADPEPSGDAYVTAGKE